MAEQLDGGPDASGGGPDEGDEQPRLADTGRVLALSDGVFAIASTLLVLELKLPGDLPDAPALAHALHLLVPEFRAYAISYLLIALFWLGHHRQFRMMKRLRSSVVKLNLLLLGVITLIPFTAAMLSDYGNERLAVALYAANIAAIFLLEMAIGLRVLRHGDAGENPGRDVRLTLVARPGLAALVFGISIPVALLVGVNAGFGVWPFLVATWFVRRIFGRRRTKQTATPGPA